MDISLTMGKQRMIGFLGLTVNKDMTKEASDVRVKPMGIAEAMQRQYTKRGKYGNVKTEYKGRMYASKLEAHYAAELDLLKKAKNKSERVMKWVPQVRFEIKVNNKKICDYYADFVVTYADKRVEVIDCKGVMTDVYKLKKKLMLAVHGIDIKET